MNPIGHIFRWKTTSINERFFIFVIKQTKPYEKDRYFVQPLDYLYKEDYGWSESHKTLLFDYELIS